MLTQFLLPILAAMAAFFTPAAINNSASTEVACAAAPAPLPTPVITIEYVSVQHTNATNALVTFRVRVTDSAGHPIQGRVTLRGKLHGSTAHRTLFGGSRLGSDGRAYLQHHFIPGTPQLWDYRVLYPSGQGHGFARAFVDRTLTR